MAVIATVSRVLEHPILQRAASARNSGLRRETPVILTFEDGGLVEGVIDLAFREDTPEFAGWTVVDFKTDREFAETSDRYIAQVRVYSQAVGAATSSSQALAPIERSIVAICNDPLASTPVVCGERHCDGVDGD